jgi:hypothetical protein
MPIELRLDNRRHYIVAEQDVLRCQVRTGSDKEYALAPLRQKGERVDGSICPSIATFFESTGEAMHGCASIQREHKRDVFEHDELRGCLVE